MLNRLIDVLMTVWLFPRIPLNFDFKFKLKSLVNLLSRHLNLDLPGCVLLFLLLNSNLRRYNSRWLLSCFKQTIFFEVLGLLGRQR